MFLYELGVEGRSPPPVIVVGRFHSLSTGCLNSFGFESAKQSHFVLVWAGCCPPPENFVGDLPSHTTEYENSLGKCGQLQHYQNDNYIGCPRLNKSVMTGIGVRLYLYSFDNNTEVQLSEFEIDNAVQLSNSVSISDDVDSNMARQTY